MPGLDPKRSPVRTTMVVLYAAVFVIALVAVVTIATR